MSATTTTTTTTLTTGDGSHALFINAGPPTDPTLGQDGDNYVDNQTSRIYWHNGGVWTDTGAAFLTLPDADAELLAFSDGRIVAADPSLTATGAQIATALAQAAAAIAAANNAQVTANAAQTAAATAATSATTAQTAAQSAAQSAAVASGTAGSLVQLPKLGIGLSPGSVPFLVWQATGITTTVGSAVEVARFGGSVGNSLWLRIMQKREKAGNDWTTAGLKLQSLVDTTDMAFIEYGGAPTVAMAFGTATTGSTARFDLTGAWTFDLPVVVGTPTASGHAASMGYVNGLFATPSFTVSVSAPALEIGSQTGTANSIAYVDFHSSAVPAGKAANDYDARILTANGSNGTVGGGDMTFQAGTFTFAGALRAGSGFSVLAPGGAVISTLDTAGNANFAAKVSAASLSVSGAASLSGGLTLAAILAATGGAIEVGAVAPGTAAGPAYVDFHSSAVPSNGSPNDFDARILSSAGSNGTSGLGTLNYTAASHVFSSDVYASRFFSTSDINVAGNAYLSSGLNVAGPVQASTSMTVAGSAVRTFANTALLGFTFSDSGGWGLNTGANPGGEVNQSPFFNSNGTVRASMSGSFDFDFGKVVAGAVVGAVVTLQILNANNAAILSSTSTDVGWSGSPSNWSIETTAVCPGLPVCARLYIRVFSGSTASMRLYYMSGSLMSI